MMQQGYGYGPPPSMRQEVTFFSDGGVMVTSSRFVVYGQMYPMNGITSVSPFSLPARRGGLIAGAIIFGLFTMGGVSAMIQGNGPSAFLLFSAITALFVWRAVARKDMHGVMISTAGMQVRALTSPSLMFVQQVVAALHQAVASR